MKWFKHFSDSHNDPHLAVARKQFGTTGPHIFWTTLEFYAKEFDHFDPDGDGFLQISWLEFQQKCKKSRASVQRVLDFFATCFRKGEEEPRILWRDDGEYLWLKVPKFIELADEYTRKRIARKKAKVSGECPESVRPRLEVEGDKEEEKKDPKPFVYECGFFKIDGKIHATYLEAFPDVDLMEHYKKMAAWLVSRPDSGGDSIMVFVYEWLKNEQGSKTAFQATGDILRGTGAKGMPTEAYRPPQNKAHIETARERDERLREKARKMIADQDEKEQK